MGKDITHVQYTYLIHLTFRLAFIDDVPNYVEHHGIELSQCTHIGLLSTYFLYCIYFSGGRREVFFSSRHIQFSGDNSVDLSLEALVAWCEC